MPIAIAPPISVAISAFGICPLDLKSTKIIKGGKIKTAKKVVSWWVNATEKAKVKAINVYPTPLAGDAKYKNVNIKNIMESKLAYPPYAFIS